MKDLKYLFVAIIATVCVAAFTACSSDDDETNVGWNIQVDTDASSTNFNSNLYLQLALSEYISSKNSEIQTSVLTESEAKSMFNSFCNDVTQKINAMGLPVLNDTYCTLYLTHAISDPYGTYPEVATRKITFTASSN